MAVIESANGEARRSDWTRSRRISWVWPAAFVVAGVGWLLVPGGPGSLVAAAGFAVAGVLCVGNAIHCRRVHCAITGPLYLLAAGVFLTRAAGWSIPGGWIIAGALAGTGLAFVPERMGKLYFAELARGRVAAVGTLVAAGLVAACCLGPTLFVVFGLSIASLGILGVLEPYRWVFLLAGLACWAVAYRQRRRAIAECTDAACGTPGSRQLSGIVLWGSLAVLIVAAVYPYLIILVV